MEAAISQLVKRFEDGKVSRRQLIQGLAALAVAGGGASASAQTGGFRTLNLDHVAYTTSDYRRIRDFYAGVLGLDVVNDNGKNNCELHVGAQRGVGVRDRMMMSLTNATPGGARSTPGIDHLAWKIENWDTDRVRAELERRGLKPRLARGGAIDTPNYVSFNVQDPDGLGMQISGIAQPGDSALRQQ
ncbi:MAG: VOC family protein [Acidimicrobiia bacterium]|nr:VOC family protein [Acidimicrobiia bacterium]